jgi:hypothetical protein
MFYDQNAGAYIQERVHPEDKKTIESLTSPRNWDTDRFKKVITALGLLGGKIAVPASNRPDSIDLSGWQTWHQVTGELLQLSQGGNEHARAIFADPVKAIPFFSDKISVGDGAKGFIDFSRPLSRPGSERVGSIHIHPILNTTQHGLSIRDYLSFLTDKKQQFMSIAFGNRNQILPLKTTATPNNSDPVFVEKELKQIENETIFNKSTVPMERIVKFNKLVCTTFGLTYYQNSLIRPDFLSRIDVTK